MTDTTPRGPILALTGGVGGAKLVWGLSQCLNSKDLVTIVNTADDDEFYGLHVSPDLDTVMYVLANLANAKHGWGIQDDTFNMLKAMESYGLPSWFYLGDRDLATHLLRTDMLSKGHTLSEVTDHLCSALGITSQIAPMTDQAIRTKIMTEQGDLSFQTYFVRMECTPQVLSIRFEGVDTASLSPSFDANLNHASALVFCPSNPFLSIDPILALPEVRKRITSFPGPRVAVSPIVGGEAIRGPTAKMLREMKLDASCISVADKYRNLCDIFVIDNIDRHLAPAIRDLGLQVEISSIIMTSQEEKTNLAAVICDLVGWSHDE